MYTVTLTMAEVIELSDDEIIIEDDLKKATSNRSTKKVLRCLNSDCRIDKELILAEEYVRRYYGVLSYPKKKRVCVKCRDEAKIQQDGLVETLLSSRLLLAEKLPPPKTTVVLTDSDSDPSDDGSIGSGSELEYEGYDNPEDTIIFLTKSLGLDRQITEGRKHLEERFLKIQAGFDELNAEYNKVETDLDTIRKDFYNSFRPEIRWQPPLDIGPSSITFQQDRQGEVIAETPVHIPNENLAPIGPLLRWELQPEELVYSMKYSLFARWVQAQVIEAESRETKNNTLYRIRYNRNTKSSGLPKVMAGRHLAYFNPCATRIPVGTRIIAKYRDDDPKNTTISGSYYVGIVAEIPTAANKYRYLVFFDDGYAQYVLHHDIRVVTEASTYPWDDVSSDARDFIREYLKMYPERQMVRLQKWNYVRTEWNGQWWKAQVKEVDGSLVKMFFPLDGRSEWIYRGSFRLGPLFNKRLTIQAQSEQPLRTIRRRTAAIPGRAVVEYGTFGQGQDTEGSLSNEGQGERRAVARKSTSARPGTPPRDVLIKVEQESRGSFTNHSYTDDAIVFQAHITCSSACLKDGDSMEKYKGISPLLYPLLFGWQRQVCKKRKKSVSKHFDIYYMAPCGRRLHSVEAIFNYLLITESALEIDCFSLEVAVNVTTEWESFRKIFFTNDISKGEENVPISGVNSLDTVEPQTLMYCNVRLPTEHVPLNLDPEFLVCCDCVDDCRDKSKCQCWQLTIQNTAILDQTTNNNAGYEYRRLYEQVQSGIYECNSRCKCSNHCLNRVVQHPLRLKLQLFKTAQRGWGVRTLHDIPRGGFICVYVGKMLNETIANEEGKTIGGDDYYAELDYIEVMENAKEGYEEEPVDPEFEEGGSDTNDSECSGNEQDKDKEDHDFNDSHMKKAGRGLAKREKSARLQERAAKRKKGIDTSSKEEGSGSGSAMASEDESKKGKDEETKDSETDKESEEKKEEKSSSTEEKEDKAEESDAMEEQSESEDEADVKQRQPRMFGPSELLTSQTITKKPHKKLRSFFGDDERVYIMDAKHTGNIGRFLNHACEPNVFVQNVFVDTHDLRFPWVAFFSISNIRAGTELTWDYSYEVDTVPGKVKYCYCGARKCRGRLL
ncbi:hypothetical protein Pmani_008367 [Petrolisthes manimaculis]|uniref:Histone-lysine N-methyltransferase eggless n=1 Tax=Petrolisthes manimaculis TaxID=1843537 RepID=A0AAE1UEP7_9EUCA|nr:hypothetical protein Pmani_008367 [Petrolisthes manimaculis]